MIYTQVYTYVHKPHTEYHSDTYKAATDLLN